VRFLFFLSLLLLVIPGVDAVGYSNPPAQREYIFEPNAEFTVPLLVSNGKRIEAELRFPSPGHPESIGTPEDDYISNYVTLLDPAPLTGSREIQFKFDLPSQMKPGVYFIDLYITDRPETQSGATVSAIATTKFRLTLRVLSPEKRVDITNFIVREAAEGVRANATVYVVSRTVQDISLLQADFEVRNDDQVVATGTSDRQNLPSGESAALFGELLTEDLAGGEYDVYVTVHYDTDFVEGGPNVLKIGTLHVDVINHTNTLLYNTTNKFLFTVANRWNRELKEVFATVSLGSQVKQTASLNIGGFGTKEYEIYFDRDADLLPGRTSANISVNFKDFNPSQGNYVQKEESFLRDLDVIAPEEKSSRNIVGVVLGVGGLFLLLALLLVFFFRRKRSDPPKELPQQFGP